MASRWWPGGQAAAQGGTAQRPLRSCAPGLRCSDGEGTQARSTTPPGAASTRSEATASALVHCVGGDRRRRAARGPRNGSDAHRMAATQRDAGRNLTAGQAWPPAAPQPPILQPRGNDPEDPTADCPGKTLTTAGLPQHRAEHIGGACRPATRRKTTQPILPTIGQRTQPASAPGRTRNNPAITPNRPDAATSPDPRTTQRNGKRPKDATQRNQKPGTCRRQRRSTPNSAPYGWIARIRSTKPSCSCSVITSSFTHAST